MTVEKNSSLIVKLNSIISHFLSEIDPEKIMYKNVKVNTREKTIEILDAKRETIDLEYISRIFIISIGKCSLGMFNGFYKQIKNLKKEIKGIIVLPKKYKIQERKRITKTMNKDDEKNETLKSDLSGRKKDRYMTNDSIEIIHSDHPLPSKDSIRAAKKIISLLEKTTANDLVVFLISGGGSALVELPVEGISLELVKKITNFLMTKGASINELNVVRKHLSAIKGGKLLRHVHEKARILNLVISDVVGNNVSTIASGPTVPDTSTFDEFVEILKCHGATEIQEVKKLIERTKKDTRFLRKIETFKQDVSYNRILSTHVMFDNSQALKAFSNALKEFLNVKHVIVITSFLMDDAESAASTIKAIVLEYLVNHPDMRPVAILFGGEVKTRVVGTGIGGRTYETILRLIKQMLELIDKNVIQVNKAIEFLGIATDGIDGNTGHGGIYCRLPLLPRKNLKHFLNVIRDYLEDSNSFQFFKDHVPDSWFFKPSFTGNNVNDVFLAFIPLQEE